MIGKLFARTLKLNPEVRHDFEAFIGEHIENARSANETENDTIRIHRNQGQVAALRQIQSDLEELNTTEDADGAADQQTTSRN